MNILYLCDEYPPGKHGGIGTSVRLLAREMVKLGHSVVVAGLYAPGYGGEDEFDDEGVKVFRFRRRFDDNLFKNEQSIPVKAINRILKLSGLTERDIKNSLAVYARQLEKLITDYKIDIIEMPDYNDYVRFCKSYVPFPVLSALVIVKLHGSVTYITNEANKPVAGYILKMEQAIINQAAAVSSVSRYTAIKSAFYFSYPHEIEVLYNGINTNLTVNTGNRDPKQVIFTGTLVRQKGIYQLLKAWNIVNEQMPDARLIILGKGSRQKAARYLSKAAGSTVSFKGHVTSGELYNYLAASSVSVFPSYTESFSLAPLEAMACGAAVIYTNRSSGPELIDDHINGLLIDPDDITQIASAILSLLNDPDTCKILAVNGNKKVKERFDIRQVAAQNIQFYNKVLNKI